MLVFIMVKYIGIQSVLWFLVNIFPVDKQPYWILIYSQGQVAHVVLHLA